MYKNARISKRHIELVVRKAWIMFMHWEETQHELDYNMYLNQRELAENAINAGHKDWKEEFKLP
jgi:hypothetical protein